LRVRCFFATKTEPTPCSRGLRLPTGANRGPRRADHASRKPSVGSPGFLGSNNSATFRAHRVRVPKLAHATSLQSSAPSSIFERIGPVCSLRTGSTTRYAETTRLDQGQPGRSADKLRDKSRCVPVPIPVPLTVAIVRFTHQGCTSEAKIARAARLPPSQPSCNVRFVQPSLRAAFGTFIHATFE
jgi:hypothetical protein